MVPSLLNETEYPDWSDAASPSISSPNLFHPIGPKVLLL